VCTALVYTLCERGELPHVRVSNAIRVSEADLATIGGRQVHQDTATARAGSRADVVTARHRTPRPTKDLKMKILRHSLKAPVAPDADCAGAEGVLRALDALSVGSEAR
jgi:hypothetical protein